MEMDLTNASIQPIAKTARSAVFALILGVAAIPYATANELSPRALSTPVKCHALMGKYDQWSAYRGLRSKVKAYESSPSDRFPISASRVQTRGTALLTQDIDPAVLPYKSELGRDQFDPDRFPKSFAELPKVAVFEVSDTVLWSDQVVRAPLNAVVRLGALKDGRPVAIVTHFGAYARAQSANSFAERALSAQLLSDLGIGPRFHGIVDTMDGPSYAVDLVPGLPAGNAPEKLASLFDRTEIYRRLRKVGIASHGDLQEYSNDGRLLIIDPEGYFEAANFAKPATFNPLRNVDWTFVFVRKMIAGTNADDVQTYMRTLRRRNDPFLHEIYSVLNSQFYTQMREAPEGTVFAVLRAELRERLPNPGP